MTLPARLPLLPPGELRGVDGRAWLVVREHVLARLRAGGPIPLDIEHAHHRDSSAPIAGLLTDFQLAANGAIDAAVTWEAPGTEAFPKGGWSISPVLIFDPMAGYGSVKGRVQTITSAALTQKPNFLALALNSAEPAPEVVTLFDPPAPNQHGNSNMELKDLQALFQTALAPLTEAISKVDDKIKAANAVLMAEVDAKILKMAPAPVAPALNAAEVHASNVETALARLVKDGKIRPDDKSAERFRAHCGTPASLAAECSYLETQPPLVATNAADLPVPKTSENKGEPELRFAQIPKHMLETSESSN